MFECFKVDLDDGKLFDELVHSSLPEGGDLSIVTKDNATVAGNPAAVISFTVELPGGKLARAQCVTTVRNIMAAFAILRGRYGDSL